MAPPASGPEFEKLDNRYNELRKRIDRAMKWGIPPAEHSSLIKECNQFLRDAKVRGYSVVGMRRVEDYAANSDWISRHELAQLSKNKHKASPAKNIGTSAPTTTVAPPPKEELAASPKSTPRPATPLAIAARVGKNLGPTGPASRSSTHPEHRREFTGLNLPYRTYLRAAEPVRFDEILDTVQRWLGSKNIHIDVRRAGTFTPPDGVSQVETDYLTGEEKLFRLQLHEKNKTGATFSTHILIGSGASTWIWIDINNDENKYVAVPKVAKTLLKELEFFSGSWKLQPHVTQVRSVDVESLIDSLRDRSRTIPLILAGTDRDEEMSQVFEDGLAEWGEEIFGLAAVVILDPDATVKFNTQVDRAFNLSSWSLRTYLPGVDLDEPTTARHNRFLGTRRLVEERPRVVAGRLGRIVRSIASTTPVPHTVHNATYRINQNSIQLLLEDIESEHSRASTLSERQNKEHTTSLSQELAIQDADSELKTLQSQIEDAKNWLEIPSLSPDYLMDVAEAVIFKRETLPKYQAILKQLKKLQALNHKLESDVSDYLELANDLDSQRVEALQRERRFQEQFFIAQKKLAQLGDPREAYVEAELPPEAVSPQNMEDLLDKLQGLRTDGIFFTGDEKLVEELDDFDQQGALSATLWDALLTCKDYIRAKSDNIFAGNMHLYLRQPPTGYRTVSPTRHAAHESDSTMNQFSHLRVFPVPEQVDPAGRVCMPAHFKFSVSSAGISTPRMHYFDNFENDGCLYIGYIGKHLRTSGTN